MPLTGEYPSPKPTISKEVHAIAKVLAGLEPGAMSTSKTMLAMHGSKKLSLASSLCDYQINIQEHLKKAQKYYAKQQLAASVEGEQYPVKNVGVMHEKDFVLERELKDDCGAMLLYIATHANDAIKLSREKNAEDVANILRQYADKAKLWALHLGLTLPDNCSMANM